MKRSLVYDGLKQSFEKQCSAIAITLWLLFTSYEQTGMAHVITTEIRDEGTFRWLILLTVEILHLSVFLFPSFPWKKTYIFNNHYHSEFYIITCSYSCIKVVTLQHWLHISLQLCQKSFLFMQRTFAACTSTF